MTAPAPVKPSPIVRSGSAVDVEASLTNLIRTITKPRFGAAKVTFGRIQDLITGRTANLSDEALRDFSKRIKEFSALAQDQSLPQDERDFLRGLQKRMVKSVNASLLANDPSVKEAMLHLHQSLLTEGLADPSSVLEQHTGGARTQIERVLTRKDWEKIQGGGMAIPMRQMGENGEMLDSLSEADHRRLALAMMQETKMMPTPLLSTMEVWEVPDELLSDAGIGSLFEMMLLDNPQHPPLIEPGDVLKLSARVKQVFMHKSQTFVKRSLQVWPILLKVAVTISLDFKCARCKRSLFGEHIHGRSANATTMDHFIAYSLVRGTANTGINTFGNLYPVHMRCNTIRSTTCLITCRNLESNADIASLINSQMESYTGLSDTLAELQYYNMHREHGEGESFALAEAYIREYNDIYGREGNREPILRGDARWERVFGFEEAHRRRARVGALARGESSELTAARLEAFLAEWEHRIQEGLGSYGGKFEFVEDIDLGGKGKGRDIIFAKEVRHGIEVLMHNAIERLHGEITTHVPGTLQEVESTLDRLVEKSRI